jgi:hypothetical protein
MMKANILSYLFSDPATPSSATLEIFVPHYKMLVAGDTAMVPLGWNQQKKRGQINPGYYRISGLSHNRAGRPYLEPGVLSY